MLGAVIKSPGFCRWHSAHGKFEFKPQVREFRRLIQFGETAKPLSSFETADRSAIDHVSVTKPRRGRPHRERRAGTQSQTSEPRPVTSFSCGNLFQTGAVTPAHTQSRRNTGLIVLARPRTHAGLIDESHRRIWPDCVLWSCRLLPRHTALSPMLDDQDEPRIRTSSSQQHARRAKFCLTVKPPTNHGRRMI